MTDHPEIDRDAYRDRICAAFDRALKEGCAIDTKDGGRVLCMNTFVICEVLLSLQAMLLVQTPAATAQSPKQLRQFCKELFRRTRALRDHPEVGLQRSTNPN